LTPAPSMVGFEVMMLLTGRAKPGFSDVVGLMDMAL
jgi:hypothetical protein